MEDIQGMSRGDYGCGIWAHYKSLAKIIEDNSFESGIEIGTAYGNLAVYIIENTSLKNLYCIDPYQYYSQMPGLESQKDYDTLFEYVVNKMKPFSGITLINNTSKDALKAFSGKIVDFAFIDGDHSYETVKWECDNYYPLIRSGGMLLGHDYNIFEGPTMAADEFAKLIGQELRVYHGNIWGLLKT